MKINWDDYRNEEHHINLVQIYRDKFEENILAIDYLQMIMQMHPIDTRESAAIALASAIKIAENG